MVLSGTPPETLILSPYSAPAEQLRYLLSLASKHHSLKVLAIECRCLPGPLLCIHDLEDIAFRSMPYLIVMPAGEELDQSTLWLCPRHTTSIELPLVQAAKDWLSLNPAHGLRFLSLTWRTPPDHQPLTGRTATAIR